MRSARPIRLCAPPSRSCGVTRTRDRIAAIREDLGLSGRRFAKVFREHVGMTPKRFARVQRFQHVLGLLERTGDPDWVQIALQWGYYDRSHFIHDFKEFAGFRPSRYFALRQEHRRHVHEGIHSFYSVCPEEPRPRHGSSQMPVAAVRPQAAAARKYADGRPT